MEKTKLIVLTGSTGGLGYQIARNIFDTKYGKLICIYRNEKKFKRMFADMLSDENIYKYRTFYNDTYEKIFEIDGINVVEEIILILNAFSIEPIQLVGGYSNQDIRNMVDANITLNVSLINKTMYFCRRGYSLRIINLDSEAANFPLSGWGNYCASKAYMNMLLSVIALENPNYKIVSYDPGLMNTNMQKQIRSSDKEIFAQVDKFISYEKKGRLNDPADVAKQLLEKYVYNWKSKNMREKYII